MIATFNVDHKSSKELRQYLSNVADQCERASDGSSGTNSPNPAHIVGNELPSVIILDNLHHVGSLGEVFNGFLSVKYDAWLVFRLTTVLFYYLLSQLDWD